jgi:hypothetical protein
MAYFLNISVNIRFSRGILFYIVSEKCVKCARVFSGQQVTHRDWTLVPCADITEGVMELSEDKATGLLQSV